MDYKIFIEKRTEKDFKNIPLKLKKKISSKILNLKIDPRPYKVRKIAKLKIFYRLRVANYRLIYEVNDKNRTINVFRIRHRKDAYFGL